MERCSVVDKKTIFTHYPTCKTDVDMFCWSAGTLDATAPRHAARRCFPKPNMVTVKVIYTMTARSILCPRARNQIQPSEPSSHIPHAYPLFFLAFGYALHQVRTRHDRPRPGGVVAGPARRIYGWRATRQIWKYQQRSRRPHQRQTQDPMRICSLSRGVQYVQVSVVHA